jgi:hypothetical protein
MTTHRFDGGLMLDRLAVALAMPRLADQRARLRTLCHEVVAALSTDDEVAEVFRASPLVGSGSRQVNPRPGTAGLRDMLKPESMICLIRACARSLEDGRHELGSRSSPRSASRPPTACPAPAAPASSSAGRAPTTTSPSAPSAARWPSATPPCPPNAAPRPRRGRAGGTGPARPPRRIPGTPKIDLAALSPAALLLAVDRAALRTGATTDELIALLATSRSEAARCRVLEAKALADARATPPDRLDALPSGDAGTDAVEQALTALMARRTGWPRATLRAPAAAPAEAKHAPRRSSSRRPPAPRPS